MAKIYDRSLKRTYEEVQYASSGLNFLYNNFLGRIILKILICPGLSKIYGIYMKRSISRIHINSFVKKNHIDMNRFEDRTYTSFYDFFTRHLKELNIDTKEDRMVSPAESKLIVYPIEEDMNIHIKRGIYTIPELLGGETKKEWDDSLKGGSCLVFRLAVNDYHRFHFCDDGTYVESKYIAGKLHTISSFSDKYKAFCKNSRVVNYLNMKHGGKMIVIEVGAMFVGKIVNNNISDFKKGTEKGWFEPGGSTIIVFAGKNVKIDDDIINNSRQGIETRVLPGEGIATFMGE